MENENLKTVDDWQPYEEYMKKRHYSKGGRLFIEDADMLNHQVNRLREKTRRQKPAEKGGEAIITFAKDNNAVCTTENPGCDYRYDFLGEWPLARRYVNFFGNRNSFTEGSASTGFGVHSRVLYNSNGEESFVKIRDEVPLRGPQAVKGFVGARPCGMRIESVVREGNDYRISNYEFECLLLEAIGCPRPEKIFSAHWFTTRNFHGMWYADGDDLENYLHFRANVPIKDYFHQMAQSDTLPAGLKFAVRSKLVYLSHLVPHIVKLAMYSMAMSKEHGTQWWIKHNKEQRIHAYYGSLDAYRAIPDWRHTNLSHNSMEAVRLEHGYDESKPLASLTEEDFQCAAAFRGGKCLGTIEENNADSTTLLVDVPHRWECAEGHSFVATPRLILLGGHWCPECFPFPYSDKAIAGLHKQIQQALSTNQDDLKQLLSQSRPWQWDKESRRNPFFAQLWSPLHDKSEDNVYMSSVFAGWEK